MAELSLLLQFRLRASERQLPQLVCFIQCHCQILMHRKSLYAHTHTQSASQASFHLSFHLLLIQPPTTQCRPQLLQNCCCCCFPELLNNQLSVQVKNTRFVRETKYQSPKSSFTLFISKLNLLQELSEITNNFLPKTGWAALYIYN